MKTRHLLPLMTAGAMLIAGCRQFFVADGSLDATDATDTMGADGSDIVADAMDADATIGPDATADADAAMTAPVRILFPTTGTTIGSNKFTARIQVPADFDWSHVGAEICSADSTTTAAWDQNCFRGHPPPDGGLNMRDVDASAPAGARIVDVDFEGPRGLVFIRFGELTGSDTSTPMPRSDSAFARVSQFVEIIVPREPAGGSSATGFESWGEFPDFDHDGLMDIVTGGTGTSSGGNGPGEVYVYSGRSMVMSGASAPPVHPESMAPPTGAAFGHVVASGGDINGDGYTDLLVGQPFGSSWGTVFVFYGGPTFFTAHPMVQAITGDSQGLNAVRFGSSLAGIGDIDRDGYDDIIVGAPSRTDVDAGASNSGAFVFHGSATGVASAGRIDYRFATPAESDGTVAGIGDIDSDGIPDFAMNTSMFVPGVDGTAIVYLHGDTTHPRTMIEANAGPSYGSVIAPIGDFNRDGFADFVIAAPEIQRVFVYSGNASGNPTLVGMVTTPSPTPSRFGLRVNGGGDFNGDGFSDFVVGADEGTATVYLGSMSWGGLAMPNDLPFSSCGGTCVGGPVSVSLDLDYDGDGYADVVSGSASGTTTAISRYLNVYRGSSSLPSMPQFTLVGPSDPNYGNSVTLAPRRRIDPLLGAALIAFDLR